MRDGMCVEPGLVLIVANRLDVNFAFGRKQYQVDQSELGTDCRTSIKRMVLSEPCCGS